MTDDDIGQGEEYTLAAPEVPLYDHRVDQAIVFFRAGSFLSCGFCYADALALALRRDVDRQRVEDLIDQGATPAQVMDILL